MKMFIVTLLIFTIGTFNSALAEDIENIEITKLTNVQLADSDKKFIQDGVAALAAAVVGYGVAHYATNYSTVGKSLISIGSGAAGMYVANRYGTEYVSDGVKIDYVEKSTNKSITVKGDISNFHIGTATLIIDDKGNPSIHQKNTEKNS